LARTIDPVRHAAKRLEILEAANRCFCRSGLRSISVSEICAEAGIGPGHLYHYFDCKDDIIEELAKSRLDTSRDALDSALARGSPAIEILVDEVTALAAGNRATTAALLFDVLADSARNESTARIVRECHAGMADSLCAVVRQGQADGEVDRCLDPRQAASMLISLVDSAQSLALRDPGMDRQQALQMFDRVIRSFLAPGGSSATTRQEDLPNHFVPAPCSQG
jgi:TetR/AcrR family transcriptional repressor of uid operon